MYSDIQVKSLLKSVEVLKRIIPRVRFEYCKCKKNK
nr:MAG TPA: hypothetical protein [Caudoviricetes sp.]